MISLLECAAQAALYASHAADIAFLVRPQEETDSAAKRASRAYRSVNKDRPSGPAERCSTAKKQEGAEAFLAAAEAIKAAANGIQGLEGSNVNEVYVRIRKVNEWVAKAANVYPELKEDLVIAGKNLRDSQIEEWVGRISRVACSLADKMLSDDSAL